MKPALAIGTVVEVDGRPAVLLEPGWEEGETVVIRSAASASHATATQEVDPHVLQWTRDVLRKIEACQMADQPPRYTDWRGILAEVANLLTTFWMASRIGPTGGGGQRRAREGHRGILVGQRGPRDLHRNRPRLQREATVEVHGGC